MRTRAVLLVCDYDPTSPLIGALRVDRFATYLTELGWSVKVLSRAGVTTYSAEGRQAPASAETQHFTRPDHGPWRRRLRRVAVVVYERLVAFPDRGVFTLRRILGHVPDLGDWTPDIVVVSGPPFTTFEVGRRLAAGWGVPWVADYRDLWTNSTYYVCGPVRRRIDRQVEKWLLRRAAATVTVSEPLADDLHRDFGVRSEVVMNGFEPSEAPAPEIGPEPGLPLRLVYTGEIYPGRRDPTPIFEAVRLLDVGPSELSLVFRGITVLPLQEQAARLGVEHLVDVGPALPRDKSLALQRSSDAQMLLMWNDPGEVGIYSGKLFEYLGSGRPVLMLGYAEGAAAQLLRERRAGQVANDPNHIAVILREWIEAKRDGGRLPGNPASVVEGLTRRDQTVVLSRLLEDLVARG